MNYSGFAYVYDLLMRDVNYNEWTSYIEQIFKRYKCKPEIILELGCGTGNITLELSKRGYEMIGLDKSSEMLCIAKEKALLNMQDILFLNQDMVNFELYGTVDVIGCFMDGLNYIISKKDLQKVLKLVMNYLNPGGLFIFDIRSIHGLADVIGNNTFAEVNEEVSYIWQNYFNNKSKISNMELTLFIKEHNNFKKYSELHRLRAYSVDEIHEYLKQSNFEVLGAFDNFTFKKLGDTSQRICFIARKKNIL